MKNVRKLTEGAILMAAFTVLLLVTIYVPVLGMVVNLFLPVPFILFAAKNDLKSLVVFMVASLMISFISGTIFALPLTLAYGLTGTVMGYLLQKNKSRTTILISGSIIFLSNLVIQYIVSTAFFHFNIIDEMIKAVHESIKISSKVMEEMGQGQESAKIIDQFEKGLDLIKTLVPSLFVMSSFIIVFFIQLLSLPIIKRFGIKVENWKPFREISLPRSLLWYYLLAMLGNMLLHPAQGTYMFNAFTNLTYILQLFMVFQGLTFIFHFFYQRGTNKSVPVVLSVLTILVPVFLYIVGILGIIDLGFDLRRRSGKKE
ncbi:MAG TPA: YybS family protein [Bacillales bacterium]|nr:YybS family protein [Bacillales bacterium]